MQKRRKTNKKMKNHGNCTFLFFSFLFYSILAWNFVRSAVSGFWVFCGLCCIRILGLCKFRYSGCVVRRRQSLNIAQEKK